MQTQEQQEQKHGFYIISTMYVEETGPNPEDLKKQPVIAHLSYKIVVPGKETILRGFYPKKGDDTKNSINTLKSLITEVEGEYRNDTKRLELARKWDTLYPNDKASYTKRASFTDEEVLKVYKFVEERLKNPGTYHLQSSNCVHEIQEAYQSSGKQGRFTDLYTSEEMSQQMQGLTMSGIGGALMEGPFPPSDKPYKVPSDLSLEDFAAKWKIPVSRLSVTENTGPVVKPNSLVLSTQPKNIITIAPSSEVVASEEGQIDETFAQLAVTEDDIPELESESKVKSIIEAAIRAFKEKFEAIHDKFTKKSKDDIEKTDKEATELQQACKAKFTDNFQAIKEQTNQKIIATAKQLQSSLEAEVASLLQRMEADCDAFYQQKLLENEVELAQAKQRAGISSTNDCIYDGPGPRIIDLSYIGHQKNSEIEAFNANRLSQYSTEKKALEKQFLNQKDSLVASIKSEASEKVRELKSSIEQKLQLKSSDKKEMKESVEKKEKAQEEKCDRKIKEIQEDTGLIERLKELVGNSGDAEAVVNEELNVFLQGVASDFGVDAVNL